MAIQIDLTSFVHTHAAPTDGRIFRTRTPSCCHTCICWHGAVARPVTFLLVIRAATLDRRTGALGMAIPLSTTTWGVLPASAPGGPPSRNRDKNGDEAVPFT
ncbi:MAG: hypothetical protein JO023_28840 [Chloroflexi bacterium]|nr:hypothetical protein [Chloroflexota bacterium]